MTDTPAHVGLLGGGVIGGGWAARFLLNGIDVRIFDPDPDAPRKLAGMLDNARRAYGRLTLAPLPAEGALTFVATPEEAAEGVGLVQESAPERIVLKQELLAAASRAAGPETLLCSSTSGLRPTLLQSAISHPERLLVAHPFNPVYLLPLVELCGGEATAPDALERAAVVYEAVGMHALPVRTEIDGFIADRLLEALWREALWLVNDGVATVQEVDDAVRYAPGIRWSVMGTFLIYRIAGGEAGMRHFIEQFGPTLRAPWTKLVDVPELTPELLETIVAQSDAQAAGRSVAELERDRDDSLISVLHALRSQRVGAGETLARWERRLMRVGGTSAGGAAHEAGPRAAAGDGAAPAPLRLGPREVPPDWIDYNGHVHEARYLQACGDATDMLLGAIGIDAAYLEAGGSYFTAETHLSHVGQLFAGDRYEVATQILGWDPKRLHLFHTVMCSDDGRPVALGEQMLLHIDTTADRVAPAASGILERIAAIAAAHAGLPPPERVGRSIAMPLAR